jgi:hypothetical protein
LGLGSARGLRVDEPDWTGPCAFRDTLSVDGGVWSGGERGGRGRVDGGGDGVGVGEWVVLTIGRGVEVRRGPNGRNDANNWLPWCLCGGQGSAVSK